MRLLETLIAANHVAASGRKAEVDLAPFRDSLPLAALTCIDARLNKLLPEAVGVDADRFIWVRNAGAVITSPTSSTVRSLAMAIYVKGAKEIAVIGHTDCRMAKFTMMELLDRMTEHGVDRNSIQLPNLHEFFGLFSSESQNVIKGCSLIRQSPVIPPKVPVHGLLIHTDTGKLDWIVNGYETLGASSPLVGLKEFVTSHLPQTTPQPVSDLLGSLAEKAEPALQKKFDEARQTVADKIAEKTGRKSPADKSSSQSTKAVPPKIPANWGK